MDRKKVCIARVKNLTENFNKDLSGPIQIQNVFYCFQHNLYTLEV